ncbi:hypothetical protein HJC23_001512 [Cyclotella cryptica]|uniref:Uncharacterized protein n=1 Tax=Cyclotella cryptica TaxID=29204 RepID=A0ABD3P519_9STRA
MNIEYYNPASSKDNSAHAEQIETESPGAKNLDPTRMMQTIQIEHWHPGLYQPSPVPIRARKARKNVPADSSGAETSSNSVFKHEAKRRKVNGSVKPQKHFDPEDSKPTSTIKRTNDEVASSKTKSREVQVSSPNGHTLHHSFLSCSEAARRMDVSRSKISRGEV